MTHTRITSTEEFKTLKISAAFIELQTKITELLRQADYFIVRRACFAQINVPNGVQLSFKIIDEMKKAQHIDEMLDVLVCSAYCSWIDLRLLETMAYASGTQASQLLENYKNAIFPIKLITILPDLPSIKTKNKYYEKVISKTKMQADMTVADLVKYMSHLKAVVMDIRDGECVLAHLKKGCLEIHWYISIKCVDKVFHSAVINRHRFHELQLHYIQIGSHPVITDPFYKGKFSSLEPLLSASSSTYVMNYNYYTYLLSCMKAD